MAFADATVDVTADFGTFDREFATKLRRAATAAGKAAEPAMRKAGRDAGDAFWDEAAGRWRSSATGRFTVAGDRLGRAFQNAEGRLHHAQQARGLRRLAQPVPRRLLRVPHRIARRPLIPRTLPDRPICRRSFAAYRRRSQREEEPEMPPKSALPDHLSPEQVIDLFDALLSNGDSLLDAASTLNQQGSPRLARSLAILGREESGKAIALFNRRVQIAHEAEGAAFVDDPLRKLWGSHSEKLKLVHEFLVDEAYWFAPQPPAPHDLLAGAPGADPETVVKTYLDTIAKWAKDDNLLKQAGFYVDVDSDTGAITTSKDDDGQRAVEEVIAQVHQIGWQLRLGEHIEAKSQAQSVGRRELRNDGYRLHLDSDPMSKLGKPGYEAQTRELMALYEHGHAGKGDPSTSG